MSNTDPVDSPFYSMKEKVIVLKAAIVKAMDNLDPRENGEAYEILSRAINNPTQHERQAILNNATRVMNK